MRKLLIGNEWYFPEDDEAVIDLVEQHMGHDTADALQEITREEIILERECGGECDETYKIQEHFERSISDAVEELKGITVHKACQKRFELIVQALEALL